MSTYGTGYIEVEIPPAAGGTVYPAPRPTCAEMGTYMENWYTMLEEAGHTVTRYNVYATITTTGPISVTKCLVNTATNYFFYHVGFVGNIHSVAFDNPTSCCDAVCEAFLPTVGIDTIFNAGDNADTNRDQLHTNMVGILSSLYLSEFELTLEVLFSEEIDGNLVTGYTLKDEDDLPISDPCDFPDPSFGIDLSTTTSGLQFGGAVIETAESTVNGNKVNFWLGAENPDRFPFAKTYFRVLNDSNFSTIVNIPPHIAWDQTSSSNRSFREFEPRFPFIGFIGQYGAHLLAINTTAGSHQFIHWQALKLKHIEGEDPEEDPNIKKAWFIQGGAQTQDLFRSLALRGPFKKYVLKYLGDETINVTETTEEGSLGIIVGGPASNIVGNNLNGGIGWQHYGSLGGTTTGQMDAPILEPWCGFNVFDSGKFPYAFAQMWDTSVIMHHVEFSEEVGVKEVFRWDGQWWKYLTIKVNTILTFELPNCLALTVKDPRVYNSVTGYSGFEFVSLSSISFDVNPVAEGSNVTVTVTLNSSAPGNGAIVSFSCVDSERVQFASHIIYLNSGDTEAVSIAAVNTLDVTETVTIECASSNTVQAELTIDG